MNNTDTFEDIAKDAVKTLTSIILTLRIMGGESFADAIADETDALIDRAIALGGE